MKSEFARKLLAESIQKNRSDFRSVEECSVVRVRAGSCSSPDFSTFRRRENEAEPHALPSGVQPPPSLTRLTRGGNEEGGQRAFGFTAAAPPRERREDRGGTRRKTTPQRPR